MEKCLITKKEIKFRLNDEYLQKNPTSVPVLRYEIEINSEIFLIKTLDLEQSLICENEPIDDLVASLLCHAIERKDIRTVGVFSWKGYKDYELINLKKLISELLEETMEGEDVAY